MAFDTREQLANVAVVAAESARLAQTFRRWPSSAWSRPTHCPGWTAADAVAHLATGGDFYAQVIDAGRRGEAILPWGASNPAEFRAARQAAGTTLLDGGPAALSAGFEHGAARLQTVLESLQEADLAQVARHPRGLVPIGLWIGMRLIEMGVHDWDIRQPHEQPARLAPTALPALLSVLPELHVQFLTQRAPEGLDGSYVLRAGDAAWGLTVEGTTATYQAVPSTAPDASLASDPESFILLSVGRADLATARHSGALTIAGNTARGEQLCAALFRSF